MHFFYLSLVLVVFIANLKLSASLPLHPVNVFDAYGLQCPAVTLENIDCPPLICVPEISHCPKSLTCPPNLSLCPDGSCAADCTGIESICTCNAPSVAVKKYVAYAKLEAKVNLTNYVSAQRSQLISTGCSKLFYPSDVLENSDKISHFWSPDVCPTKPASLKGNENWLIVSYAVFGLQFLLSVIWHFYKHSKSVNVPVNGKGNASALKIIPYKSSFLGSIAKANVYFTCLSLFVGIALIVLDQYSAFGPQYSEFYQDFEINAHVFVVFWHISAVYFVVVNNAWTRMSTYYRIQCAAHEATSVRIEKLMDHLVLLDDDSVIVSKVRVIEKWINEYFGMNILVNTRPVLVGSLKYFEFQCTRYVYNEQKRSFVPFEIKIPDTIGKLRDQAGGLTNKKAENLLGLVGPNFISVDVPSSLVAIGQEFRCHFYIYQLLCVWVYLYFNYEVIGFIQLGVVLIAAFVKVRVRLTSERKIKSMAEYDAVVKVFRDGDWQNISSQKMVPGDVFQVEDKQQVPCDAVLLTGDVIADESGLTGEPLPIRKFPLPYHASEWSTAFSSAGTGKRNSLFAGTTVLQSMTATNSGELDKVYKDKVVALVTATGRTTDKGMLVTQILFPTPISFIFDMHLKIVVVLLLIWGTWWFGWTMFLMGRGSVTSWFYGIFIISNVLSPLIPAALVVGQAVSSTRLKAKDIFCINLPRIIVSGKVRIFCFDKTGTLTREGLEFFGVKESSAYSKTASASGASLSSSETCSIDVSNFDRLIESASSNQVSNIMKIGLSTCHAVTSLNGTLIGNPVDIEMFSSTGYNIDTSMEEQYLDVVTTKNQSETYYVLARHEFLHSRSSMSVIVIDKSTGRTHIFVKGSFEKIKACCDPDSIPSDYDKTCENYAKEGCYVLCMAHRDIGVLSHEDNMALKGWTRDEVEKDLNFVGLVMFKNKLRDDSEKAIGILKEGDCRIVMITGDNAFTGIHISNACGIVPKHSKVILGDMEKDSKRESLVWNFVRDEQDMKNDKRNDSIWKTENDTLVENLDELLSISGHNIELAVTGAAFDYLVKTNKIRKYLLDIRILARMTPAGKVACVELYMEHGITAMCGDGGNDCGALRAAHVGVAMSEAEASIVAPFSTKNRSIMSCVEILKEGRCALATSFASYKFLVQYGCTMITLEMTQFYFSVIAPQYVWVAIDSLITVLLSWTVTLAKPAKFLAKCRLTARLLGAQTIASVTGQFFINAFVAAYAFVMLFQQPWFRCNETDSSDVDQAKWWVLGDNYEAETIAIVVLFQFINSAAAYNFGHKFRQSWGRNYFLALVYLIEMAFVMVLALAPPNPVSCFFRINCGDPEVLEQLGYAKPTWDIPTYNSPIGHNVLPFDYKIKLFSLCMVNCVVVILYERLVVIGPVGEWMKKQLNWQKKSALFKL